MPGFGFVFTNAGFVTRQPSAFTASSNASTTGDAASIQRPTKTGIARTTATTQHKNSTAIGPSTIHVRYIHRRSATGARIPIFHCIDGTAGTTAPRSSTTGTSAKYCGSTTGRFPVRTSATVRAARRSARACVLSTDAAAKSAPQAVLPAHSVNK